MKYYQQLSLKPAFKFPIMPATFGSCHYGFINEGVYLSNEVFPTIVNNTTATYALYSNILRVEYIKE